MNNLAMLIHTAYYRIRESSKKTGSYTFTTAASAGGDIGNSKLPVYVHYSLKEKGITMDLLSVTVVASSWIVALDVTWTEDGDIYSLDINGEEADCLCPSNIQAVVPDINIRLLENALLWWLTETTFPPEQDDEDEYI